MDRPMWGGGVRTGEGGEMEQTIVSVLEGGKNQPRGAEGGFFCVGERRGYFESRGTLPHGEAKTLECGGGSFLMGRRGRSEAGRVVSF